MLQELEDEARETDDVNARALEIVRELDRVCRLYSRVIRILITAQGLRKVAKSTTRRNRGLDS